MGLGGQGLVENSVHGGGGWARARDRKVRRSLGIRLLNGIMQTQPPSLHWYITVHTCFSGKKKGQPRSALITRSASAGSGLIALPHPKPGTKHEKKDERVNYVRMAPCTPRARHTPARRRHASSPALDDTRLPSSGAPTRCPRSPWPFSGWRRPAARQLGGLTAS